MTDQDKQRGLEDEKAGQSRWALPLHSWDCPCAACRGYLSLIRPLLKRRQAQAKEIFK